MKCQQDCLGIQMTKEEILLKLKTGNKHLDGLTEAYFISVSRLKEPIIGNESFMYLENDFDYSLREYSITHSCMIESYQSPTQEELLKLNDIPENVLTKYKKAVDEILDSYKDITWTKMKQHNALKQQLIRLADEFQEKKTVEKKMFEKLQNIDPLDERTTRFLNDILEEMQKAGVNQVESDRYIIIDKLINLYLDMKEYLDSYDFREKKKYLKKLEMNAAKLKLHGYIKSMMTNGYIEKLEDILEEDFTIEEYFKKQKEREENNNELLQRVRWFLFYLIYDAKKIDIFMIHSVLGYKYDGAVKVYQKLFLKDATTGKNDNFLHHTNVLNVSENSIYDREHEAKYDLLLSEIVEYKGLKEKEKLLDSTYKYALEEKMYAYDSLYEQLLTATKS